MELNDLPLYGLSTPAGKSPAYAGGKPAYAYITDTADISDTACIACIACIAYIAYIAYIAGFGRGTGGGGDWVCGGACVGVALGAAVIEGEMPGPGPGAGFGSGDDGGAGASPLPPGDPPPPGAGGPNGR